MFGFQRLDAYKCSIVPVTLAAPLSDRVPRGYASLGDQLRRAALSVPLNIAEGTGKFDQDARRFYAIARGSALECAAIADAFEVLGFAAPQELGPARELLERIVSMLTGLLRD